MAYFDKIGLDLNLAFPDAILFRTRTGSPYREATLSHDFATVRAIAFSKDQRKLMDMCRSGVIEAVAGDATVRACGKVGELDQSFEHAPQGVFTRRC